MKTYLLFQGDFYYPGGGYSDFMAAYGRLESALQHIDDSKDWYQIVSEHSIIESGIILRGDDALNLRRINESLVINEPANACHGNTVLIAWYEKLGQQFAILKSVPK